ncbi:UDP-3-O-(3-hydroxymyristoyl)glucosamine N-acyltransferase [Maricurvus nonylphenolicus]|uniref:UDP-3-O-(3-hydroxymyristoyl)glucosamine N-acyltransferase n=1 Tax=Maricurvus nonylphenolicus TaxID=1008307 RepID=UPI0036F305E6
MAPSDKNRHYRLQDLASFLDADLVGDPECEISGLNTLQDATIGQLAFLANPVYQKYLATTKASAVIIHPKQADAYSGNKLIIGNPYLAYARLTERFAPQLAQDAGVHATASVDPSAEIAANAVIGANAVVDAGAHIGAGVVVGAGSYVGADSIIGEGTRLYANVSVYHGVSIGKNGIFHSGSVIGADGFGFAPSDQGWVKIHQLGGVVIGDNVEVGAGTTIDRGALDDTVIADGVILDNQVQIAHNVRLGENTAIAGCVAVAGSTHIGKNCTIGGKAGIIGHLQITDNVHVTAMSLVTKSITESGSYSSGTGVDKTEKWRKNAARFAQLDKLARRLAKLEKNQ